jgi:copper homeostasis protein
MLRKSESYMVPSAAEVRRLCAAARDLAKLRVDGLVLGFLRDGEVDENLTERILSCAPNLKATFHHAFEETRDPAQAIRRLKTHRQIDHILTAGGKGHWPQKKARLASSEREARPEITILAGGGLEARVIKSIRETTSIHDFHVGRAARLPQSVEGAVHASRVRELTRMVGAAPARER